MLSKLSECRYRDIPSPLSTEWKYISTAAILGITTGNILEAADRSSEAVFQKFYHKPIKMGDFGKVAQPITFRVGSGGMLICSISPSSYNPE